MEHITARELAGLLANDPESADRVFAVTTEIMRAAVRSRLAGSDGVADVVQEAWIGVVDLLRGADLERLAAAWSAVVSSVAKRRAMDELDRRRAAKRSNQRIERPAKQYRRSIRTVESRRIAVENQATDRVDDRDEVDAMRRRAGPWAAYLDAYLDACGAMQEAAKRLGLSLPTYRARLQRTFRIVTR